MKLLLDQNLSPRLVSRLADVYPGTMHVSEAGLARASDEAVWTYARAEGYTIVSKDADFSELAVVKGFPPQVVWIRRGNCSTAEIEGILRRDAHLVRGLWQHEHAGILLLH